MQLILIRHGLPQRIENVDGEAADPHLSDTGHSQAARVAAWLHGESIDRLYSSPMARARQTAAPIASAHQLDIQTESQVAEFDRDATRYVPVEELKQVDYPAWLRLMRGETSDDFDAFAAGVIGSLEAIIESNPGRCVAVACHGGVINAWAAHVMGFSPRLFFQPDYTSINRFMCASSGERSVASLNETAHLRGG